MCVKLGIITIPGPAHSQLNFFLSRPNHVIRSDLFPIPWDSRDSLDSRKNCQPLLFISKDNSHCPIFFTRLMDALAHVWPSLLLHAFPTNTLLPQILRRVREQRHKLILIAPLWRNQPWVSELFQLLEAAPWPIPLRRDLLSQVNGMLWHPRPRLWAFRPPRACPKHDGRG